MDPPGFVSIRSGSIRSCPLGSCTSILLSMRRNDSGPLPGRLRQAREECRLQQEKLAELVGVAVRNLRDWEAGRKLPTYWHLQLTAAVTRKPIGWFLGDPVSELSQRVPLYDEVPAGSSREPAPQDGETVPIPDRWISVGAITYCLRVRGDSMEPLLRNGDVVAVRQQPDAENGQIVIATLANGEYAVKQYDRTKGKRVLRSLNRNYGEITMKEGDCISGLVVGMLRDL